MKKYAWIVILVISLVVVTQSYAGSGCCGASASEESCTAGAVVSSSADQLVVKEGEVDVAYTVNADTKFVNTTAQDVLANDAVTVTYNEIDGNKVATVIAE